MKGKTAVRTVVLWCCHRKAAEEKLELREEKTIV